MDPVTLWLFSQAVGPDAYSRLVGKIRDKSEYQRLKAAIRTETGIRPGRRYRRWLDQKQTWDDLVSRQSDAYERLIDNLAAAETQTVLRRRSADRDRATKLVNATIGHFLTVLDPSLATAVADFRSEQRHREIMERLDASASFQERLMMLPPPARRVLQLEQVHKGLAEHLVDAVLRGDPRVVIAAFVAQPPEWLAEGPATIKLALAELAKAYGLRVEAARLYESVADLGLDRPRYYAEAAFEWVAGGHPERRGELIEKARAAGPDPYVDVVEAGFEEDWANVLRVVDRETVASDPFMAQVYALALQDQESSDASITFLTEVTNRWPEYPGIALRLAGLLLERSTRAGTTSRVRDLDSALRLAISARDLRRQWRGDSGEAVATACQVALIARDFGRVIRLGTSEPGGEAWPEEAAKPEVQFNVAQAAMAVGNHDVAGRLATSGSGFRQALIMGDLLAASKAPRSEIDEQFRSVWSLVETEQDKVDFWVSASAAGVEPMPGEDELDRRDDDFPVLVRASQHIACGRVTAAIELLRPHRQNEIARGLLTDAYLRNGDVDNAVAELVDMAERFDNTDHLLRVVRILVEADQPTNAAELTDRTLRVIPVGRFERNLLHEIGVAAAHNRGDWRDMEARVRAWIDESGPDHRRRWLLVQALYNQADPKAAWSISQENGDLEPTNPLEAQLWIALHTEHKPSPETLSAALALCDRFPDNLDVRTTAVNAFFLMEKNEGDVNPNELSRWHALVEQRAKSPSPNDTFSAISVPEDLEGLVEALRPLLEPQAHQVEEWRTKVRRGWPYGMLAVAAGRPYTTALVQRAAGFLPIASTNTHVLNAERDAALAAIDGAVIADLSGRSRKSFGVIAVQWSR